MFINIGEKIRLRREAKGVSQDELAQYLGVTCKDVLKWEKGEEYPPFEQIPVIAHYFGATTDELMCMDQFDNEDKIRAYTDAFGEKVTAGNIKEAVETVREGLRHFPEEFRLKCLLMYGLYLSCDRPAAVKHYSAEILTIGEDILAHCTEDAIRLEAKRLLCLHYHEDLTDAAKAREIALSLPGRKSCREDMLPLISEGDAKLSAIAENISAYTTLLTSAMMSFVESDATLSRKEKIDVCEAARKIRTMVYPNGDIYGGAYLHMMLLRELAILYMSEGMPEKALDCLQDCAKCAADFDALPKATTHTSPMVKRLRFAKAQLQISSKNKKTPLKDIFLNEIMPLSCFESVKYSPRITEICSVFEQN